MHPDIGLFFDKAPFPLPKPCHLKTLATLAKPVAPPALPLLPHWINPPPHGALTALHLCCNSSLNSNSILRIKRALRSS